MIEPEAPVRPTTLGLQSRALFVVQLERGPIIDRWLAAAELDLSLEVEFLGGFVGRVGAPCRYQRLQRGVVAVESLGLAVFRVRGQSEPAEVSPDGADKRFGGPLLVGIVK